MTDLIFDAVVRTAKANAYARLIKQNEKLKDVRDSLIDALQLAMRQLEDPNEDIYVIRENAQMAIQRARMI